MAFRQLKTRLLALLQSEDLDAALAAVSALPAEQAINPLFSFLYHGDPLVRWHAVTAMGEVTTVLADRNLEAARVIMRRLMWNLNDESGGIGWGSPEAMGAILARHGRLAREFASILVSYVDPGGNYLEHPGLQQGALWGVGRLGRARPDLAAPAAPHLRPLLLDDAPGLRGLALWAAIPLPDRPSDAILATLRNDPAEILLYQDPHLVRRTIGQLAREAG